MEKIFQVSKTVQECDSDCWAHWIDHQQISLHSSLEKAEKKIQFLLNKKIEEIPALKELNPHHTEEKWEEQIARIKNNIGNFTRSLNGQGSFKYPIYTIEEITLED